MSVSEKIQNRRDKDGAKLLEEMAEISKGTPAQHTLLAVDEVSSGEHLGQSLKAAVPFLKGKTRKDGLVFYEFTLEDATLIVLLPFSRDLLMPVEYMFRFKGTIPRSVFLKRSFGSGVWTSAAGDERRDDEFCAYLKDVKEGKGLFASYLSYKADWNLKLGKNTIKLQWAFQLLPLPGRDLLWIHKKPYEQGFFGGVSKYDVAKAIETFRWARQALMDFGHEGDQGVSELLAPSLVLLHDPELAAEFRLDPLYQVYRDPVQARPAPAALKEADQVVVPEPPTPQTAKDDPLTIAQRRLAAGEISVEEFEKIKKALGG
jgi:hypothetical protein